MDELNIYMKNILYFLRGDLFVFMSMLEEYLLLKLEYFGNINKNVVFVNET